MPGFAEATASTLIAGMPELGQVSNEVAAALVGVAPYDDDSGKRRGERYIKGGRRWVRNALYMPCLGAATQNNPVFKAFYQRLIAKGKEPKVALIACMRKLIVILNTMIARRREVGSETIRGGLTSARISRSDRDRAHAKLKDR